MVSFSLLSLLVSTLLATIAWLLVSTSMSQRPVAVRPRREHAESLDAGLAQSDPDLPALIDSLQPGPTADFVRYQDAWFGGVSPHGSSPVPTGLVHLVLSGMPATERTPQETSLAGSWLPAA